MYLFYFTELVTVPNFCLKRIVFNCTKALAPTLTKIFVQKLYKMHTKIIQNTKFVHILYTKIVQTKISYDNEYARNVHQIYCTYTVYTKHVQTVQNVYN